MSAVTPRERSKSEKLISEVISEVSDLQRQVLVKALTAVFEEMEEMSAELKHYRDYWKRARSIISSSCSVDGLSDSDIICTLIKMVDYENRHG